MGVSGVDRVGACQTQGGEYTEMYAEAEDFVPLGKRVTSEPRVTYRRRWHASL